MGTVDPNLSDPSQRGCWWSASEHDLFVQAYQEHGKNWKKIAGLIGTRSVAQVRSHAQKYFMKLKRRSAREQAKLENRKLSSEAKTDVPRLLSPIEDYNRDRLLYENYLMRSYIQTIANVNLAFFRELKKMFGDEPGGMTLEQSVLLASSWSGSAPVCPFIPSFAGSYS